MLRRWDEVRLFVWAVRSCVTARVGSVDKRRGHASLLSLDLSQSMMRLSWMLELNPIISMYLSMIIIVLLTSIMATIIMLMLVGLTAMIITVTTGEKYDILAFILCLLSASIENRQSGAMCI